MIFATSDGISQHTMDDNPQRPTHILVECVDLLPSVRLGVLAPLHPLEEQGRCVVRFKETATIVATDIEWCDILICVRGFWIRSLRLAQAAKEHGRLVMYFLDDDLLGIPREVPSGEYLRTKTVRKTILEILALADALWCVNERLAEKMKRWHTGKTIMGKVPAEPLCEVNEESDRLRILYAGSTDHRAIVDQYLLPALEQVHAQWGNRVLIDIIGPQISRDYSFVRSLKYFDNYECYEDHLAKTGYHIGLAPILTSEFYACKYFNKFIEYSRFGIAGIYTRSEPYTQIVDDEKNGFLCENTVEDWVAAITRVVENDHTRKRCAREAQRQLKEEFNPAAVSTQLCSECVELVTYRAPSAVVERLPHDAGFFGHYFTICKIIWIEEGIRAIPIIIGKACKLIMKSIRGQR